ncbi:MAG: AAA family ATPase [Lachnospiraceae bacterium]|nr:AAA family ATPase [Lachnospiraceae bacterium]
MDDLRQRKQGRVEPEEFLDLLTRMLYMHHNKKVFVIIDEYDVPMAKTVSTQAYE